jgi:hypothetical protein
VDRLEVISLVDNIVDLQSAVPDGVLRFWQWASDPKHAAALPDAFVPAGVGNMYRFPEHLPASPELAEGSNPIEEAFH